MKRRIKKIIDPFYKRYHFWLHKKPRKYRYKTIYTIVQPTVFSPINTKSTKVFLDFISKIDLANKQVLELGCGSGIISVYCASKGAKVTATDINKIALKSLKKVSKEQGFEINCIYSDLFENIDTKQRSYNYILINPPYYPKKPENIEEKAWFCGADFEYFKTLFTQLEKIISVDSNVYMILSDACNFDVINVIATENNLKLKKTHSKKLILEVNYIYAITKV